MRKKSIFSAAFLIFAFAFFPAAHAQEAAPQDAVDNFLTAIRSMTFPAADEAAQRGLEKKANAFLDLETLSKKALAPHWDTLTEEQRASFLSLMARLIEKVGYPKSARFMGDYEITYPSVEPEGSGFNVTSVIKQEEEALEAEVIYHVYQTAGAWKIDDVILDGVSITEDLQFQFDKIIADSGFSGLLDTMQKRLTEAEAQPPKTDA